MKITIKFSLVSFAAIIILLSGGLISFISYVGIGRTTYLLSEELMENICLHIIDRTLSHMQVATISSEISEFMMKKNPLSESKRESLDRYFRSILSANSQVDSVYYGNEKDGRFLLFERRKDGTISQNYIYREGENLINSWEHENREYYKENPKFKIEANDYYDPRARPWYTQAVEKKDHVWTDIYMFMPDNVPGLTHSNPIYADGKLEGVFGLDVGMKTLSFFLGQQKIGKTGKAFFINNKTEIIAHPFLKDEKYHSLDEKNPDPEDKEIIESVQEFRKKIKNKTWGSIKLKPIFFSFDSNGITMMNMYYALQSKEFDWMIGIIVPEDDYMHLIKQNNRIIWITSIVLMAFAVLAGLLFARRISEPLSLLEEEMQLVKNFEMNSDQEIHSFLEEVDNMAVSFHGMKQGLRSFQKYVPDDLVRELISMGKEAVHGGERKQITIYFSDLVGFTSISEQLSPEELVELLDEYFETCSQKILEQKGTIDKYIGDSIMAFWGSPTYLPDHSFYACAAALSVKESLLVLGEKWAKQGKPVLKQRIGIHRGDAIVGNFGSQKRMNYTALGDSVNLASRMEGLNKFYGTEILISETVYEEVKESMTTRKIDLVAVKGKLESTAIYELICKKENATPLILERIELFHQGFALYLQRDWEKASRKFRKILKLKQEDSVSKIFIERCEIFQKNPPAANWTGVFQMKTK